MFKKLFLKVNLVAYVFAVMVLLVSCIKEEDIQIATETMMESNSKKETKETDFDNMDDDNDSYKKRYEISIDEVQVLDESSPKEFTTKKIFDNASDYPRVDGSTALLPLMASVRKNALGISLEDAENDTSCNKTNYAWYNLSVGDADVLIVGEMPREVKENLHSLINGGKKSGILYRQVKYAPIRREGLVFIVNKNNPVDNLTKEQIIDIYTGKITNWKEVGGEDKPIEAFQREETSGSQTIFRKVLMKDIEPEKKEVYYYPGEMNSLIDVLASYDNSSNAIGYSVYYYVTQMYKNDNLKLIKVDGVMPSNDTIGDFTYPLLNESYVAMRVDEPEDSNAHKLYDYIRSNMGKEAIIEAGYVPVK